MHTVCQMVKNIVSNFGASTLIRLPLFPQFLQQTFQLTTTCLKANLADGDDAWNMEAFDILLMMWSSLR